MGGNNERRLSGNKVINKLVARQRKPTMEFPQREGPESANWNECLQCANKWSQRCACCCRWRRCSDSNNLHHARLARLAPTTTTTRSHETNQVEANGPDQHFNRQQLRCELAGCEQSRPGTAKPADSFGERYCWLVDSARDQALTREPELVSESEKRLAGFERNQKRVLRRPPIKKAPLYTCCPARYWTPSSEGSGQTALHPANQGPGIADSSASSLNKLQGQLGAADLDESGGKEGKVQQPLVGGREQSCSTFAQQLEGQRESFEQRTLNDESGENNHSHQQSSSELERDQLKEGAEERNEELVIEFDKVLFLTEGPNFLNPTRTREETKQVDCDSNLDKQEEAAESERCEIQHMDWKGISDRFGKMPYYENVTGGRGQLWRKIRQSCFCHLLTSSLDNLFPIMTAFSHYRLPGDLLTDLIAGLTIAVLHIPQGMAYGLLAGVEPIHGLYVSFVPVLIMALMSRSRHVSYGTFAIISMLLANATDSIKILLKQQVVEASLVDKLTDDPAGSLPINHNEPLVLTNNHQQVVAPSGSQLLQSMLIPSDSLPPINLDLQRKLDNSSSSTLGQLVGSTGIWSPFDVATAVAAGDFVMPSNIQILTSICIIVGLIQMAMALMRLGILSLMFSDQLVSSFTTASAIHVVSSQLSSLVDLNLAPVPEGLFRVIRVWWTFASQLFLDGCNTYTALLSLVSILFLLIIKEIIEPVLRRRFKSLTCLPSELVLMSFVIFVSWNWQLSEKLDIRIIGVVPTGLPAPQVPRLDIIPAVFQDALTIALVSFAMNLSLAQVYAKKFKYSMEPNQELFALGSSNFVGSFFSCFPCASSLSRSAVQSNLDARSPLCPLISCAIVVSIVCYFAPILHDLPRSTLSCIIIVALRGILVQIKDLHENWRLSKLDASVWMVTFVSVIAFGVTYGLVLGIVASLFMVFLRLLTPNYSILGQLPGTEIYVDRNAFAECHEIGQVKIFRFNSALCYLNRTMFKSSVQKSLPSIYERRTFCSRASKQFNQHSQAESICEADKVQTLIIDCSALAYCDYSGAATLVELIEELEEHKLNVYLAACPLKLITMFEKMQKLKVLEQNVFPTISDAVGHARYLRSLRSRPAESVSLDDNTIGGESCIQSVPDSGCKPSIS